MGKKGEKWREKEKRDIRAIAMDEIHGAFTKYDNGWYEKRKEEKEENEK